MSFLSWLDYSETERRKMLDVISLFQQKESRDELGLGTVRDAFADMFFPGTSTIQTRARYFLFIPWIYKELERRKKDSETTAWEARKRECDLIEELIESGEDDGVIGKLARRNLQRLPSNIYWSGLQKWRILLFAGSQTQYHKWFDKRESYKTTFRDLIEDPEGDSGGIKHTWNPAIPEMPREYPNGINFKLETTEAQFLKDQILRHCRNTILSFLVLNGRPCSQDVQFIWMHPQYNEFDEKTKEKLEHARLFSEIMHGAAWLYNLMLAEEVERGKKDKTDQEEEKWSTEYREQMEEWHTRIDEARPRLEKWDIKRFWEIVAEQNPYIPSATRTFCTQWISYSKAGGKSFDEFVDNASIQALIRDRERFLKRENARLSNSRALENWRGDSGIGQLDYRWRIVRIMVNDIYTGLNRGEDDAKTNR